MKFIKNNTAWCLHAVMIAASLHLTGLNALASETGGNWRSTYDLVMIWLNFGRHICLFAGQIPENPFDQFFARTSGRIRPGNEPTRRRKTANFIKNK